MDGEARTKIKRKLFIEEASGPSSKSSRANLGCSRTWCSERADGCLLISTHCSYAFIVILVVTRAYPGTDVQLMDQSGCEAQYNDETL